MGVRLQEATSKPGQLICPAYPLESTISTIVNLICWKEVGEVMVEILDEVEFEFLPSR